MTIIHSNSFIKIIMLCFGLLAGIAPLCAMEHVAPLVKTDSSVAPKATMTPEEITAARADLKDYEQNWLGCDDEKFLPKIDTLNNILNNVSSDKWERFTKEYSDFVKQRKAAVIRIEESIERLQPDVEQKNRVLEELKSYFNKIEDLTDPYKDDDNGNRIPLGNGVLAKKDAAQEINKFNGKIVRQNTIDAKNSMAKLNKLAFRVDALDLAIASLKTYKEIIEGCLADKANNWFRRKQDVSTQPAAVGVQENKVNKENLKEKSVVLTDSEEEDEEDAQSTLGSDNRKMILEVCDLLQDFDQEVLYDHYKQLPSPDNLKVAVKEFVSSKYRSDERFAQNDFSYIKDCLTQMTVDDFNAKQAECAAVLEEFKEFGWQRDNALKIIEESNDRLETYIWAQKAELADYTKYFANIKSIANAKNIKHQAQQKMNACTNEMNQSAEDMRSVVQQQAVLQGKLSYLEVSLTELSTYKGIIEEDLAQTTNHSFEKIQNVPTESFFAESKKRHEIVNIIEDLKNYRKYDVDDLLPQVDANTFLHGLDLDKVDDASYDAIQKKYAEFVEQRNAAESTITKIIEGRIKDLEALCKMRQDYEKYFANIDTTLDDRSLSYLYHENDGIKEWIGDGEDALAKKYAQDEIDNYETNFGKYKKSAPKGTLIIHLYNLKYEIDALKLLIPKLDEYKNKIENNLKKLKSVYFRRINNVPAESFFTQQQANEIKEEKNDDTSRDTDSSAGKDTASSLSKSTEIDNSNELTNYLEKLEGYREHFALIQKDNPDVKSSAHQTCAGALKIVRDAQKKLALAGSKEEKKLFEQLDELKQSAVATTKEAIEDRFENSIKASTGSSEEREVLLRKIWDLKKFFNETKNSFTAKAAANTITNIQHNPQKITLKKLQETYNGLKETKQAIEEQIAPVSGEMATSFAREPKRPAPAQLTAPAITLVDKAPAVVASEKSIEDHKKDFEEIIEQYKGDHSGDAELVVGYARLGITDYNKLNRDLIDQPEEKKADLCKKSLASLNDLSKAMYSRINVIQPKELPKQNEIKEAKNGDISHGTASSVSSIPEYLFGEMATGFVRPAPVQPATSVTAPVEKAPVVASEKSEDVSKQRVGRGKSTLDLNNNRPKAVRRSLEPDKKKILQRTQSSPSFSNNKIRKPKTIDTYLQDIEDRKNYFEENIKTYKDDPSERAVLAVKYARAGITAYNKFNSELGKQSGEKKADFCKNSLIGFNRIRKKVREKISIVELQELPKQNEIKETKNDDTIHGTASPVSSIPKSLPGEVATDSARELKSPESVQPATSAEKASVVTSEKSKDKQEDIHFWHDKINTKNLKWKSEAQLNNYEKDFHSYARSLLRPDTQALCLEAFDVIKSARAMLQNNNVGEVMLKLASLKQISNNMHRLRGPQVQNPLSISKNDASDINTSNLKKLRDYEQHFIRLAMSGNSDANSIIQDALQAIDNVRQAIDRAARNSTTEKTIDPETAKKLFEKLDTDKTKLAQVINNAINNLLGEKKDNSSTATQSATSFARELKGPESVQPTTPAEKAPVIASEKSEDVPKRRILRGQSVSGLGFKGVRGSLELQQLSPNKKTLLRTKSTPNLLNNNAMIGTYLAAIENHKKYFEAIIKEYKNNHSSDAQYVVSYSMRGTEIYEEFKKELDKQSEEKKASFCKESVEEFDKLSTQIHDKIYIIKLRGLDKQLDRILKPAVSSNPIPIAAPTVEPVNASDSKLWSHLNECHNQGIKGLQGIQEDLKSYKESLLNSGSDDAEIKRIEAQIIVLGNGLQNLKQIVESERSSETCKYAQNLVIESRKQCNTISDTINNLKKGKKSSLAIISVKPTIVEPQESTTSEHDTCVKTVEAEKKNILVYQAVIQEMKNKGDIDSDIFKVLSDKVEALDSAIKVLLCDPCLTEVKIGKIDTGTVALKSAIKSQMQIIKERNNKAHAPDAPASTTIGSEKDEKPEDEPSKVEIKPRKKRPAALSPDDVVRKFPKMARNFLKKDKKNSSAPKTAYSQELVDKVNKLFDELYSYGSYFENRKKTNNFEIQLICEQASKLIELTTEEFKEAKSNYGDSQATDPKAAEQALIKWLEERIKRVSRLQNQLKGLFPKLPRKAVYNSKFDRIDVAKKKKEIPNYLKQVNEYGEFFMQIQNQYAGQKNSGIQLILEHCEMALRNIIKIRQQLNDYSYTMSKMDAALQKLEEDKTTIERLIDQILNQMLKASSVFGAIQKRAPKDLHDAGKKAEDVIIKPVSAKDKMPDNAWANQNIFDALFKLNRYINFFEQQLKENGQYYNIQRLCNSSLEKAKNGLFQVQGGIDSDVSELLTELQGNEVEINDFLKLLKDAHNIADNGSDSEEEEDSAELNPVQPTREELVRQIAAAVNGPQDDASLALTFEKICAYFGKCKRLALKLQKKGRWPDSNAKLLSAMTRLLHNKNGELRENRGSEYLFQLNNYIQSLENVLKNTPKAKILGSLTDDAAKKKKLAIEWESDSDNSDTDSESEFETGPSGSDSDTNSGAESDFKSDHSVSSEESEEGFDLDDGDPVLTNRKRKLSTDDSTIKKFKDSTVKKIKKSSQPVESDSDDSATSSDSEEESDSKSISSEDSEGTNTSEHSSQEDENIETEDGDDHSPVDIQASNPVMPPMIKTLLDQANLLVQLNPTNASNDIINGYVISIEQLLQDNPNITASDSRLKQAMTVLKELIAEAQAKLNQMSNPFGAGYANGTTPPGAAGTSVVPQSQTKKPIVGTTGVKTPSISLADKWKNAWGNLKTRWKPGEKQPQGLTIDPLDPLGNPLDNNDDAHPLDKKKLIKPPVGPDDVLRKPKTTQEPEKPILPQKPVTQAPQQEESFMQEFGRWFAAHKILLAKVAVGTAVVGTATTGLTSGIYHVWHYLYIGELARNTRALHQLTHLVDKIKKNGITHRSFVKSYQYFEGDLTLLSIERKQQLRSYIETYGYHAFDEYLQNYCKPEMVENARLKKSGDTKWKQFKASMRHIWHRVQARFA